MGLISTLLNLIFGDGRNVLRETAEVFRPNAEADAGRMAAQNAAALAQYAAEFSRRNRSPFDRLIDGLNRLPRPAMAFGTLGLVAAAMVDPVWFAARMQGLALVPEALWWLMGAIVSFYFGARHQAKGQEFQRSISATLDMAPVVARNITALERLRAPAEPAAAGPATAPTQGQTQPQTQPRPPAEPNPALAEWRQQSG